jgi:hypothetical protein
LKFYEVGVMWTFFVTDPLKQIPGAGQLASGSVRRDGGADSKIDG